MERHRLPYAWQEIQWIYIQTPFFDANNRQSFPCRHFQARVLSLISCVTTIHWQECRIQQQLRIWLQWRMKLVVCFLWRNLACVKNRSEGKELQYFLWQACHFQSNLSLNCLYRRHLSQRCRLHRGMSLIHPLVTFLFQHKILKELIQFRSSSKNR